MNDLGSRMKSYEDTSKLDDGAVILRLDGKSFHTWTKNRNKPFDSDITSAMLQAGVALIEQMQNFKLAYLQSDEATFLLYNEYPAQPWLGNRPMKMCSVAASIFTQAFNTHIGSGGDPAFFDSRVHNIPTEDAANNFIWRQQDWQRNSVSMYARTFFSQKQLHGRNVEAVKAMLRSYGKPWEEVYPVWKYGTFIYPSEIGWVLDASCKPYDEINELVGINVTNKD